MDDPDHSFPRAWWWPGLFDWYGRPLSLEGWTALLAGETKVAVTDIETPAGENIRVSTVWTGTDLSYRRRDDDQPPRVFETMVFGPSPLDEQAWKWSTEEQARAGHQRVTELVNALLKTPDQENDTE
jgi:hypothetical protein